MYVLYSRRACKVFLARLLFSQRSVVLAVRPVQILSSFKGGRSLLQVKIQFSRRSDASAVKLIRGLEL